MDNLSEDKVVYVTISDLNSLKSDIDWMSRRISDLSNDLWLLYDYFRLKKGLTKKDKSEAESLITQAENKIAEMADAIKKRTDPAGKDEKRGETKYGDVKFADPKNKKYPIDSKVHVLAAWRYINMPRNSGKYSSTDLASIKGRIKSAAKKYGVTLEEGGKK